MWHLSSLNVTFINLHSFQKFALHLKCTNGNKMWTLADCFNLTCEIYDCLNNARTYKINGLLHKISLPCCTIVLQFYSFTGFQCKLLEYRDWVLSTVKRAKCLIHSSLIIQIFKLINILWKALLFVIVSPIVGLSHADLSAKRDDGIF